MPSTLAMIRTLFRDEAQRSRAVAIWTAVMTAGVGLPGAHPGRHLLAAPRVGRCGTPGLWSGRGDDHRRGHRDGVAGPRASRLRSRGVRGLERAGRCPWHRAPGQCRGRRLPRVRGVSPARAVRRRAGRQVPARGARPVHRPATRAGPPGADLGALGVRPRPARGGADRGDRPGGGRRRAGRGPSERLRR
jgi:hypothetical protein